MYGLKGDQTGLLEPVATLLGNSRKSINRQIGRAFRKEVAVLVVESSSNDVFFGFERGEDFLGIILVGEGQRRRAVCGNDFGEHGKTSGDGLAKGQILVSKKCSARHNQDRA